RPSATPRRRSTTSAPSDGGTCVVGGPERRVRKHLVGVEQAFEAFRIAAGLRVGMVTLGQVTEHAVDRVVVRVRTQLQQLVVVDEGLRAHGGIPWTPVSAGPAGDLSPRPAAGTTSSRH